MVSISLKHITEPVLRENDAKQGLTNESEVKLSVLSFPMSLLGKCLNNHLGWKTHTITQMKLSQLQKETGFPFSTHTNVQSDRSLIIRIVHTSLYVKRILNIKTLVINF